MLKGTDTQHSNAALGTIMTSPSSRGGRDTDACAASTHAAAAADTAAAPDCNERDTSSLPAGSSGGAEPPLLSALLDASLLSDRHKAFEVFKKSYRHGQVCVCGGVCVCG